jgi:hypothetical protein
MNTKGNLAFHWNESDGNAIVTHVHTDCPGLENSLSQQADKPPLFFTAAISRFRISKHNSYSSAANISQENAFLLL